MCNGWSKRGKNKTLYGIIHALVAIVKFFSVDFLKKFILVYELQPLKL